MLDRDLAELYIVENKRLKEAVRRNSELFPEDFMFEMEKEEFQNWRTQFATSKSDRKGLRYAPFCFTEHGVLMLSSVLNSDRAIAVNIQIIRVFTKIREMLSDTLNIRLEIEEIKKKLANQTKISKLSFLISMSSLKKMILLNSGQRLGIKKDNSKQALTVDGVQFRTSIIIKVSPEYS